MSGELFQLLSTHAFDVTWKLFSLYLQKSPLTPKTTIAKKESAAKNVIELIFVLFAEHFYNVLHKRKERKKVQVEVHWFFAVSFSAFRGTLRDLNGYYEREGKPRTTRRKRTFVFEFKDNFFGRGWCKYQGDLSQLRRL